MPRIRIEHKRYYGSDSRTGIVYTVEGGKKTRLWTVTKRMSPEKLEDFLRDQTIGTEYTVRYLHSMSVERTEWFQVVFRPRRKAATRAA